MKKIDARYVPLLATTVVLVALYAAGCLDYKNFGILRVSVDLLGDSASIGVAAMGSTLVIFSSGIDLSALCPAR